MSSGIDQGSGTYAKWGWVRFIGSDSDRVWFRNFPVAFSLTKSWPHDHTRL